MGDSLVVTDVKYFPASSPEQQTGLLGFIRFRLGGGLDIDGVTLRRTQDGRLTLSYPRRRRSRHLFAVKPANEGTHRSIERQVFDALDLKRGGAR